MPNRLSASERRLFKDCVLCADRAIRFHAKFNVLRRPDAEAREDLAISKRTADLIYGRVKAYTG